MDNKQLTTALHVILGEQIAGKSRERIRKLLLALYERSAVTESEVDEKKLERTNKVRTIYNFWVETFQKAGRVNLNSARAAKIAARLNEGYSVEDCMKAIANAKNDKFLMGDNPDKKVYDDIMTILKSGSTLERHRDATLQSLFDVNMKHDKLSELQKQANEALKAGKNELYKQLNEEILRIKRKQ